jgi:hypothetical protein
MLLAAERLIAVAAVRAVFKRLISGAKARFCIVLNAWAKAQAYLRSKGNGNNKGKGEIQGFFPFGFAQAQNDDVEVLMMMTRILGRED